MPLHIKMLLQRALLDFLRGICNFILKCLFPLCPLRLCSGDSAIKYDSPLEEREKRGKLRSLGLLGGGVGLTSKMARGPVAPKRSPAMAWSPWRADPWRADPWRADPECASVCPPVHPQGLCLHRSRHGLLCGPSPPSPRIGLPRNA